MNGVEKLMERGRSKSICAALAVVVGAMVVMPVTFAGAAGNPQATASASVKQQVKQLKRQVKRLRREVKGLARQPGPQGPQGPQGPPGPSTGPAGGDLMGDYPNPLIGPSAVGSLEIADDAVGTEDIARNSIGGSQIADSAVTSEDIANNSIGTLDIGDNAVTTLEIANGTVSSADLGASAVRAADLGPAFAVASAGVLVSPGTSKEATVSCPAGSRLLSGGFEWLSADADGSSIISSSPTFLGDPNTTWVVRGRNDTGGDGNTLFAEALCLQG